MTRLRNALGILPAAPLPAFAWPGGYLIVYGTISQEMICADCANSLEDSDPAISYQVLEGDYEIDYGLPVVPICENCNQPIDPADRQ